jgi:pre-mRNA cleavage complex 2 protein Pcf11
VKIAPVNSIAVASAKAMMSRDPRLKMASMPPENIGPTNSEDFSKQQHLMQHFKLHIQSKLNNEQSSLLNDTTKGTSESEGASVNNKNFDNKRTKESIQKKEPIVITNTITTTTTTNTTTTNTIVSQRNSSNNLKDQFKSSSSKGSTTRSSSSASKTSSSSSSTISRKTSSKSRTKQSFSSSSNSSSPNKILKLEDNLSLSVDKRLLKRPKSRKIHSSSPVPVTAVSNGNGNNSSYRIPRRTVVQESLVATATSSSIIGKSAFLQSELDEEEQSGSLIISPPHHSTTGFKEMRLNARMRNYVRRNKEGSRSPEIIEDLKEIAIPDASKDEDLRAPIVNVNVAAAGAALDTSEFVVQRVRGRRVYILFREDMSDFFFFAGTTMLKDCCYIFCQKTALGIFEERFALFRNDCLLSLLNVLCIQCIWQKHLKNSYMKYVLLKNINSLKVYLICFKLNKLLLYLF